MATIETLERKAQAAAAKAAKNGQDRALQLLAASHRDPMPADAMLQAVLVLFERERDYHAKRQAAADGDNERRYHAGQAERYEGLLGNCRKALEETYTEMEVAGLLDTQAHAMRRLQQLGVTA